MSMKPQAGAAPIIELGIADVDMLLQQPVDQNVRVQITSAISNYIMGTITYKQALDIFTSLKIRTETLEKMRQIKECDEKPLPAPEAEPEEQRKKTKPWTSIEDQRLLAGILRNGLDNWSTVAIFVGNGRTRGQCSQRWTRGLDPHISKDTWSIEEERLLMTLVGQFGDKSWTRIASIMRRRSDVQCRYHYQQMIKGKGATSPTFHPMQTPQFVNMQPRYSLPRVTFQPQIAPTTMVKPNLQAIRRISAPSVPERKIESHMTNLDQFLKDFQ